MSYESRFENEYKNYKVDFIELLDDVEEGRLSALPDMRAELDVVYAQAAKADDYEAKAKAWDRVYEAFEKAKNEHEFSNGVCTIMNEYESGGSDNG